MNIVDNLNKEKILKMRLPIHELLDNSLYYPACGYDANIIRYCGNDIKSFFYCDYIVSEEKLLEKLDNFFEGYKLIVHRHVTIDELTPNGVVLIKPPMIEEERYFRFRHAFAKPYAHWAVFERKNGYDETYGPEKLSLVYIGGEGVATYQALYWSNRKAPKALAMILDGYDSMGCGWTRFIDRDGPLAWVVFNNKYGTPDTIFYRSSGKYCNYTKLEWENYEFVKDFFPYRRYFNDFTKNTESNGVLEIWVKKIPHEDWI